MEKKKSHPNWKKKEIRCLFVQNLRVQYPIDFVKIMLEIIYEVTFFRRKKINLQK